MTTHPTSDRLPGTENEIRGHGHPGSRTGIGKSHATIICWEERLAAKQKDWSPPAPVSGDITVEGDEVYTRCAVNP